MIAPSRGIYGPTIKTMLVPPVRPGSVIFPPDRAGGLVTGGGGGGIWDPLDARWDESFRLLTIFKERKGHCDVPSNHKENGFSLGQWAVIQRRNKDSLSEGRKLSEERKQKLDALGFRWGPKFAANWERGFEYLVKFQMREGHCRVSEGYIEDGFTLGTWVAVQRRNRHLPEQRRKRLDELGFVWDPHESAWEEGFRYLTIFIQREGHCVVPKKHIESGFNLGQWLGYQRQRKDTLSEERRQHLEQLGFVWDPPRLLGRKASAI